MKERDMAGQAFDKRSLDYGEKFMKKIRENHEKWLPLRKSEKGGVQNENNSDGK